MKINRTWPWGRATAAVLLGCSALLACRVGGEYTSPELDLPAQFAGQAATATGTAGASGAAPIEVVAELAWWRSFQDEVLDQLAETALAANQDLRAATSRIARARALRDAVRGGQRPSVDAQAHAGRAQVSSNGRDQTAFPSASAAQDRFALGLDATWELDLVGKHSRDLDAAGAEVEVAREEKRQAALRVLGEVARLYIELRGLEHQQRSLQANLELQTRTVELTRARTQAGLGSELDLARAQALLESTKARVPRLWSEHAAIENALAVVCGKLPGGMAPWLQTPRDIPQPPTGIAAGLPSEVLRRRPDVRASERRLARAFAVEASAIAELYPRLILGVGAGLESQELSTLVESGSKTWSLGADLLAPVLHGGKLRAQVRARAAERDEALALYKQQVLVALQEVEDALTACARMGEQRETLLLAQAAQRRAHELASDLYAKGLADYFSVLDAQRGLLEADTQLASGETDWCLAHVTLYKALGGGWAVH